MDTLYPVSSVHNKIFRYLEARRMSYVHQGINIIIIYQKKVRLSSSLQPDRCSEKAFPKLAFYVSCLILR